MITTYMTDEALLDALRQRTLTESELNHLELQVQTPDGSSLLSAFDLLREQNLSHLVLTLAIKHNPELCTLPEGLLLTGFVNLHYLELSDNHLTELPADLCRGLVNLHTLVLSDNHLTELPADLCRGLVKLRSVYFDKNRLKTLPETLFEGLQDLHSILLYQNRFTHLPQGLFQNLSQLAQLCLIDNQLLNLEQDAFKGSSVRYLQLDDNYQLQKDGRLVLFSPGACRTDTMRYFFISSRSSIEVDLLYDRLCSYYEDNHPDALEIIELSLDNNSRCEWAHIARYFSASQRAHLQQMHDSIRPAQFQSLESAFNAAPPDVTALIFSFAYNTNPGDAFELRLTEKKGQKRESMDDDSDESDQSQSPHTAKRIKR